MKLKSESIPASLTPQMKEIIKKFDKNIDHSRIERDKRVTQSQTISQFDFGGSLGFEKTNHQNGHSFRN